MAEYSSIALTWGNASEPCSSGLLNPTQRNSLGTFMSRNQDNATPVWSCKLAYLLNGPAQFDISAQV